MLPLGISAQSTFQYDLNGNVTNVVATIPGPPTIIANPVSQSVYYGQDASLSVDTSGTGPFSYQWYQNGALIQNATNSTLFLSDVTNSGLSYSVVVSNSFGSVTSSVPATVGLNEIWTGGASADWFNPLNWNPNRVPDSSDSIIIPAGSGAISLTSPVTITRTLNWASGAMIGSLTVASNGSMNISGNVAVYGTWTNNGTINANNVNFVGGTITLNNSGTFKNNGNPVTITGTLTNATLNLSPTSGSWVLNGGTLLGGTVFATNGVSLVVNGSGMLNGVTVSGNLDVGHSFNGTVLTVTNGLTLSNALVLVGHPSNQNWGAISFTGTQTLGGTGTVVFGNYYIGGPYNCTYNSLQLPIPNTSLTIGPGITVHGQNGAIGFSNCFGGPQNVGLINQGTILADVVGGTISITGQPFSNQGLLGASNGGQLNIQLAGNLGQVSTIGGSTLTLNGTYTNNLALNLTSNSVLNLNGNWFNAGSINATNATLNLGGAISEGAIGLWNRTGGSVNLTGTINNSNAVLSLNVLGGSCVLNGATILGGIVSATNGAALIVNGSGMFNGVTVSGNLDVGNSYNGTVLTVTNGLTLSNALVLVGHPSNQNWGAISFAGSQTLAGTGSIVFGNFYLGGPYNCTYNTLQLPFPNTSLTIGPGITVHGQNGAIGFSNCFGGPQNVGLINQGTILADVAGGTISITGQPFSNQGLLGASNGGQLNIQLAGNLGQVTTIGGTLTLNGTYTNNLTLNLTTNSVLNLNGNWFNAGSINATNATLNLGGAISENALGLWNRTGGTVNLTGTINNSNAVLSLNALGGSCVLNGATILGGVVSGTNGAALIVNGSGMFNGVTVSGNLDVGDSYNGTVLTVTNGLTLSNALVLVGHPSNQNWGAISFTGSQTLAGTGSIVFGNFYLGGPYNCTYNTLQLPIPNTSLTIGPGITVHGQNGAIGFSNCFGGPQNVGFINQGTILADVAGGTISITGQPFTNQGTLGASVGTLNLSGNYNLSGGSVEFGLGGVNSFGKMSFSGSVPLAGIVQANLRNGFVPAVGNSFPVLSYGSASGVFSAISLPTGFVWQTNYGPTTFTLAVSAPQPVLQVAANSSAPFLFQFIAPTNAHYTVLASTNVAAPLSNWPNLGTPSLLSNSLYQFTDTQSVSFPARFYILRSP
jgi:hypothetical protein